MSHLNSIFLVTSSPISEIPMYTITLVVLAMYYKGKRKKFLQENINILGYWAHTCINEYVMTNRGNSVKTS